MRMYQVLNESFQPVPKPPFATERDAVAHIKALQEIYQDVFYVVELNVTSTIQPQALR